MKKKNDMFRLDDVILPTQKTLYAKISQMFKPDAICNKGSYILVPGTAPIMLLAHMDTVHKEPVQRICKTSNGTILMSPQGIGGDDRCGVYALLTIRRETQHAPWLLFTCDEEIGGVGASKFCKDYKAGKLPRELADLKLLIEIDRKGSDDAVYYDCENPEFEAYITSKGFKTEWGSFSDISLVAPALGVAAVNLSSGYYNAHTQHEYINTKQLNATIKRVKEIVEETIASGFPQFEYIEAISEKYITQRFSSNWRDFYREYYGTDLTDIPAEYRDAYLELLDWYSPEELDTLRAENGDQIIQQLYDYEFNHPGEAGCGLYELLGWDDDPLDEGTSDDGGDSDKK